MSQYEKPSLTVLALNGNEQLCGSCTDRGANILLSRDPSSGYAGLLEMLLPDTNLDGTLTRNELANVFGSGEAGCMKAVDTFCKFTGAITVAWS